MDMLLKTDDQAEMYSALDSAGLIAERKPAPTRRTQIRDIGVRYYRDGTDENGDPVMVAYEGYWAAVRTQEMSVVRALQSVAVPYPQDAPGWSGGIQTGPTREEMLARLARRRYERETGGVTWQGWQVDTDDRAQGKMGMAYLAAGNSKRPNAARWKMRNGRPSLDNAEFAGMVEAVYMYIQACYDHEAKLADEIEASDYPGAVDIEDGWPSSEL